MQQNFGQPMEIALESQKPLDWQKNLKRFYIIKSICIVIASIFIVCTIFILSQDNSYYSACNLIGDEDNIGNLVRASMVMLLVYHIFEFFSLIHEVFTVKNVDGGGRIRLLFKCNQCFGVVVYIFIQVVYFRKNSTTCFKYILKPENAKTETWLITEIAFFYSIFVITCVLGCCVGCKNHNDKLIIQNCQDQKYIVKKFRNSIYRR